MNNTIGANIVRFVVLVLIQVLVLNHVNFMGYINPYIYILFVAIFPLHTNRLPLLFFSFLLGLTVDIFADSGGIHAAAALCIAYIRPLALKFCFGTSYEHQTIKFSHVDFAPKITYFTILTFIHHFILYLLEFFNVSQIILILQKTLFSGIFTIIVCILITILFSRSTK